MENGKEKNNAKLAPASFYCRHMLPGVCGYSDENVLLDADTIKRMMPSMAGIPVFLGHQTVDLENLQTQADGFVFDCFYNELDGWFWSRFVVHSDAARQAIAQGQSVSNAYLPMEWGSGGQHLNVDYTRKIVNAEFTHLAIVPNPRYEEAKIFTPEQFKAYQETKRRELSELQNSKETKGITMLKFFNKSKTEITNDSEITDDSIVKYDDKEITVKEFKELMNGKTKKNDDETAEQKTAREAKEAKENADKEEEEKMNAEYDVDGEKVTMKDLMNSFRAGKTKKNEQTEEEKQNSKLAEQKLADEKKNNKKFFEELRNANNKTAPVQVIDTREDKIKRGSERY